MRFSIAPAVALLACAGSAFAQVPPSHRPDNADWAAHPAEDATLVDGPGNGLQLELNVFREGGVYSTDSVFGLAGSAGGGAGFGGFVSTLQPLVNAGYQFDQNAILLGIGVAATGGQNGSGGSTLFGVSGTYRRYMSPLRTGKISCFGEASVTFSTSIPSSGSSAWGIGVDVGAGAEWLFVRNFGLFGKALLAYGHVNIPVANNTNVNLDAVGLIGDVGLSLHL